MKKRDINSNEFEEDKEEQALLYWFDRSKFFCEIMAKSFPDKFENYNQVDDIMFQRYIMLPKFINVDRKVQLSVGFWWGYFYFISKQYCNYYKEATGEKLDYYKQAKDILNLYEDEHRTVKQKKPQPVGNPNWAQDFKKKSSDLKIKPDEPTKE